MSPVIRKDSLVVRDGTQLPLRRWNAQAADQDDPQAVIVALHGMSDYSNAFQMPATVWAKLGITTLAYDQRGFGRSSHPGLWAGSDLMRSDFCDAVAAAKRLYPGVPVFALGESMGGAVLLSALASAPQACPALLSDLEGAILVAPAVWSRSDMPVSYRLALFVVAHLFPTMILSNSAASHVITIVPSDNVAMLIALGRDPLFQKTTRADTLYGLVNLMDEAQEAASKLKSGPPILLAYGAKDQIIPATSTREVIAALGDRAVVRRYEKGYHMLLRDLEGEKVDKDLADWILAQHSKKLAGPLQAARQKDLPAVSASVALDVNNRGRGQSEGQSALRR